MIYLASNHRGFKVKEELKKYLRRLGYNFEDLGNKIFDPDDDYTDFAERVAKKVSKELENKGILICGSGIGMTIVANKFKKIRAALCFNEKVAELSRKHNDSNVLCLPADFLPLAKIKKIIKIWLKTKFSNEENHKRRIEKITSYNGNKN